jgi:hypothetical protein
MIACPKIRPRFMTTGVPYFQVFEDVSARIEQRNHHIGDARNGLRTEMTLIGWRRGANTPLIDLGSSISILDYESIGSGAPLRAQMKGYFLGPAGMIFNRIIGTTTDDSNND